MDNEFENDIPVGPEENPLPVTPKPSLRSRILKPIVLIPAIGAAIVLLSVGVVSANTSKAVTFSAIDDLGDLITETDAMTVLMKSYNTDGRITFTIEEGDILPTDLRVNMWMNKNDSKYVLQANAIGEDVTLYLSETDLIGETSILSDSYGLNFESLFDDIKSAEWLAEYKDEISEMEEQITAISKQMTDMEKASKDGQKLMDKYYNLLFETIFDNAKVTSTSESGNRVITIVVDNDCLAKSLDQIWKKAAKDKKLTRYLDDNFSLDMIMKSNDEYDSWAELLSDADIREDACNEIEKQDFEIKVEITASSIAHNLKKLKVSLEISDQNVATATIDRTEKNVTKLKLSAGGEVIVNAKLVKDGDNLSGKLAVLGKDVFAFKWDYSKKDKQYKLTMDLPSEKIQIVLKGDYEATGKRFYIKAKTLEVNSDGETMVEMKLNVSLEIVTGEKTPDFPKSYKNVFKLDETALNEIGEELMSFAEEFKKSEEYRKLDELINGSKHVDPYESYTYGYGD